MSEETVETANVSDGWSFSGGWQPIVPFEPVPADRIPAGGEWIHQIKWDGVRMLTYYDGNEVRLVNRNLRERTAQYPELQPIRQYCAARSVVLDGELIAFDERKPSFREIMRRDNARNPDTMRKALQDVPIAYIVFDIVYLDGEWIADKPLEERQRLLGECVIPSASAVVHLAESFADGEALLAAMQSQGMEGVVSKLRGSAYAVGGKDARWQKKKIVRELIAVVGGVTYRDGAVNALLLGLRSANGELRYIGHAGAGKLNDEEWRAAAARIESGKTGRSPFGNVPERSVGAVWVSPVWQVRVRFMEWTADGNMRQPVIQSIAGTVQSES